MEQVLRCRTKRQLEAEFDQLLQSRSSVERKIAVIDCVIDAASAGHFPSQALLFDRWGGKPAIAGTTDAEGNSREMPKLEDAIAAARLYGYVKAP